jgi:hypothetical protein
MKWLLRPYGEQHTYQVLAYLLLGLPLGTLYFTILVTGFSLGLGLIITLLGIPVLVITLLIVRGLATFERGLASSLLDAPMPHGAPSSDWAGGFFWAGLRDLVFRFPAPALSFRDSRFHSGGDRCRARTQRSGFADSHSCRRAGDDRVVEDRHLCRVTHLSTLERHLSALRPKAAARLEHLVTTAGDVAARTGGTA